MKNRSAIKRHNQSEVRRMRNRSAKSEVRTTARKYTEAVHAANAENAAALLRELSSQLDSAARKGILTKIRQPAKSQGCSFCTTLHLQQNKNEEKPQNRLGLRYFL